MIKLSFLIYKHKIVYHTDQLHKFRCYDLYQRVLLTSNILIVLVKNNMHPLKLYFSNYSVDTYIIYCKNIKTLLYGISDMHHYFLSISNIKCVKKKLNLAVTLLTIGQ